MCRRFSGNGDEPIKLYSELFTLKQQLEGAITDTQIELVWGIGLGIWKRTGGFYNLLILLIRPYRDRTYDQEIKSLLLYQLS